MSLRGLVLYAPEKVKSSLEQGCEVVLGQEKAGRGEEEYRVIQMARMYHEASSGDGG